MVTQVLSLQEAKTDTAASTTVVLEAIRADARTYDIPVIIVTGEGDLDLKRKALEMGADDLLNKPICTAELVARLGSVLRLKAYQNQIKAQNALLEAKIAERTHELTVSRQEILWRLAKAGEYHDEQTGNHVVRVARYCQVIAEALGFDSDFVERLTLTSPLHDIGKIAIPDSILRKPGKLTPDEWAIMQQHSALGARILREDHSLSFRGAGTTWNGLRHGIEGGNPLMEMAASIALSHHEKWNGSGYPQGLVGEAIPMEARIVAIADVYDALSSARPYKPAFSEAEVIRCMAEGAGHHFDPYAYSGAARSFNTMRAIRMEYPDDTAEAQPEAWKKAA